MRIDQQGRTLWEQIRPPQRAAGITCFCTGYLVHLYAFTNLIPNSDGLSRVFDLQQMTVSGRWFLHYASVLNQFTQMPAAIGLVSIFLLSLAAILIVNLLDIRSRALSGLLGAVMAAFPCLGYTFLYMFTASAYCLAIFLAVLSVWLAQKGRLHWLAGVLLLACVMGTYQAYVTVAIGLSMLVVLREVLDRRSEFSGTLRIGLSLVAYLAAGTALYYGILMLTLNVKHLELLSYLGINQASSGYPLAQLPALILDTYKQVIAFFFIPGTANGFSNWGIAVLNLVLILLAAFFVYHRMERQKIWQEVWRPAVALVLVSLFPLGINFSQIISPYSAPTPLMKYAYVLVYVAVLLAADLSDGIRGRMASSLSGAVVATVILLFCFVNTNNLLYTASAQAQRATESYLTRLLTRIEDCPGYQNGMELVVIGAIPEEHLKSDILSYTQIDHYSVPMHTVAPLNKHIYYYFQDWLNLPIQEPSEETMRSVSDDPEFQKMPLYPERGSVRVLDGRVVVRLQESYTPKSDFELAYENRR